MKNASVVAIVLFLAGCGGEQLYFDDNGLPHGTGWREYRYKAGTIMAKEFYEDGQLERSIWFKPDGTVIRDEDWQHGSGTGIYLREDGSIRIAMSYVNGIAHGMAVYYNSDGSVDKLVEFVRGSKAEATSPLTPSTSSSAQPDNQP